MQNLLVFLRILLGIACATLLLFMLSYPHSIIPPNPHLELLEGISLYSCRHLLWFIPFLCLEFVAFAGPKRNLVWFISLCLPMLVAFLLWPILQAYRPELVHPTFSYEDGKLSEGLFYMSILLGLSFVFRCALLRYLFQEPREAYEGNDVGLMDLDISKAQTVREIAATPQEVKVHFLFGAADSNVIARFYSRMAALLRLRKLRRLIYAALVLLACAWFFTAPSFLSSPQQAVARDWERMYECERRADGHLYATPAAMYAAYRVLSDVSRHEALAGMSFDEAEKFLRLGPVPAEYKLSLRDESDLPLRSAEDIFVSRTRFLTLTDGLRRVILFVRTNQEGDRINICELQDEGWNAVVDAERRKMGSDWRNNVLSR